MIIYQYCPVCKSEDFENIFSAKDYTVSGEVFSVSECKNCTLRFTQNVPSSESSGKYYASETYISHSDTQTGVINKLYHCIRKKTLGDKKNLLNDSTGKQSGKMLDVGCGTGAFLHTMNTAGWECTGIEPDETARNKAAELYGLQPLPAEELFSLPKNNYDAITLWHVLEHVHELDKYAVQLRELLAPEGKLFIAVPNYKSYDAEYYGKYWAAYDVPRHLYHFSPESMKAMTEKHGLVIKNIKPMWFDSFYVSMLSEKNKNRTGNMLRAFYIGLKSNLRTLSKKEKCSSLIYIISKA